jgi:hypothetical protein
MCYISGYYLLSPRPSGLPPGGRSCLQGPKGISFEYHSRYRSRCPENDMTRRHTCRPALSSIRRRSRLAMTPMETPRASPSCCCTASQTMLGPGTPWPLRWRWLDIGCWPPIYAAMDRHTSAIRRHRGWRSRRRSPKTSSISWMRWALHAWAWLAMTGEGVRHASPRSLPPSASEPW